MCSDPPQRKRVKGEALVGCRGEAPCPPEAPGRSTIRESTTSAEGAMWRGLWSNSVSQRSVRGSAALQTVDKPFADAKAQPAQKGSDASGQATSGQERIRTYMTALMWRWRQSRWAFFSKLERRNAALFPPCKYGVQKGIRQARGENA